MSERYVARSENGLYLTNRKATGRMYESRSTWGVLDAAKIFNTKGSATNSAKQSGCKSFEILPVEISVVEI